MYHHDTVVAPEVRITTTNRKKKTQQQIKKNNGVGIHNDKWGITTANHNDK